jgi:polysaccharide biosynthesis/export protein
MKKIVRAGILGFCLAGIVLSFANAQQPKDLRAEGQPQGEVVADSDQYVIGPEDVLYINVWKEDALTKTVGVRMDGNISLPLVQEIKAAGVTPLQLKEALTDKFKEFIENPNVSVTVMEANSFKVYVSGQVKTPGVYRLRSETSIVQIISMAGGFTDWANQKKIIIIRKENGKEKRMTVNYMKIVQGDDLRLNVNLKAGDTIIVP